MFREKMKDLFRVSAIVAVGVAAMAMPNEAKAGPQPTWTKICAGNSNFKMSYWAPSDTYMYYRNANAHIPGASVHWVQTPTYGCPWGDRPPIEATLVQRPMAEFAAGFEGGQTGGYIKPDISVFAGKYVAERVRRDITDPENDDDHDDRKIVGKFAAEPCIGCDTTPGVQYGSAVTIGGGGSGDGNKCAKFNAGAGGYYKWLETSVDVTPGAANWLAHSGLGLNMVNDQGAGQSIATDYVSTYCQANPDPAGFAHHIEFGRSCSLTAAQDFQGSQKVFARYTGCYTESSIALTGQLVPIYADTGPKTPFLGGGGQVSDDLVERAVNGVALKRRVVRTTR